MTQNASRGWIAMLIVGVVLSAGVARASVPLIWGFGGVRDYGTHCLSPNDDGSSARIDLTPAFPSGLRFFSATHTSAFVNTNGNITFSGSVSTYTPNAFPVANQPMIAPYWGDVDTRGGVVNVTIRVPAPNSAGVPSSRAPMNVPIENFR